MKKYYFFRGVLAIYFILWSNFILQAENPRTISTPMFEWNKKTTIKAEDATDNTVRDVTFLITNPDFSSGNTSGWNLTIQDYTASGYQGSTYTNQNRGVVVSGFAEFWHPSTKTLGDGEISQVIADLPEGTYRLSADIIAVHQGGNATSGVYLFARDNQDITQRSVGTANGVPEHYEVVFNTTGGDVTIGIRTENTTANWIAADNFILEYCANSSGDIEENPFSFDWGKTYYLYNKPAGRFFAAGSDWGTRAVLSTTGVPVRIYNANSYLMSSKYPNTYIIQDSIEVKGGWYDIFVETEGGVWTDRASQGDYFWDIIQDKDSTIRIALSSFNPAVNPKTKGDDVYLGWNAQDSLNIRLNLLSSGSADNYIDWTLLTPQQYTKVQAELKLPTNWEQANDDNPANFTSFIVNPEFDNDDYTTGWSGTQYGQVEGKENAEHFNKNYNTYQILTGLPAGMYRVNLKAFYRAGSASNDADCYFRNSNPSELQYAKLYVSSAMFNGELPICQVSSGASYEQLGGNESVVLDKDGNQCYIPNNMIAGAIYFAAGKYNNGIYVEVGEDGKLIIGIRKTQTIYDDWTLVDGWTLMYYGTSSTHYSGEDAVNELDLAEAYRLLRQVRSAATTYADGLDPKYGAFATKIEDMLALYSQYAPGQNTKEEMYDAIDAINAFVEDVKQGIVRINDVDVAYGQAAATASGLLQQETKYSGYEAFYRAVADIQNRAAAENAPLITDVDNYTAYYADLTAMLETAIATYQESANTAFPQELALLANVQSQIPTLAATVENSHIVAVDVSQRSLTEFPFTLLALPYLRTVDASDNAIADFIPLSEIFEEVPNVEIDLRNQRIEREVEMSYERIIGDQEALMREIPTLLFYNQENDALYQDGMILNLSTVAPGETSQNKWGVNLGYARDGSWVFGLNAGISDNAYRGQSGDLLWCSNPYADAWTAGSYFPARFYFQQGDANFIDGVSVADLQTTINYIYGGYRNYPFNYTAANTYVDNTLNVQDIICTINILLSQTQIADNNKLAGKMKKGNLSVENNTHANLFVRDGKLVLQSETPIAALDIQLSGEGTANWHFNQFGLLSAEKGNRVIAYSLSNVTLPSGETILADVAGDLWVEAAELVDSEAKVVGVTLDNPIVTGIVDVNNAEGTVEHYSISGQRLSRQQGRINIIRKNGKTYKQINKQQ